MLTAKQIENLPIGTDTPIDETAYPGLRVRISPKGLVTFYHRYNHPRTKKSIKKNIGRYGKKPGHVSLAIAIRRWGARYELIRNGMDPGEQKEIENARANEEVTARNLESSEARATLQDLIDDHIADREKTLRSALARRRMLERHLSDLLATPAHKIERSDVIGCLKKIENAGTPVMRNRVLRNASAVYNWAIKNEWPAGSTWRTKYSLPKGTRPLITVSPFLNIEMLKEQARDHIPTTSELKRFFQRLPESKLSTIQQDALMLIFLTGTRGNEVCAMQWSEVHGDEWRIPGDRTKNGKAHLVYLAPQAKAIIDRHKGHKHVFHSLATSNGHILLDGIEKKLRVSFPDMGITPFIIHDARRLFASWLGERGVPEEVHDRLLNHWRKSIRKTYNVARYNSQARQAWLDWANYLQGLTTENVLAFEREA